MVSEIHEDGPAGSCGQLYIGDAILSVNDADLREVGFPELKLQIHSGHLKTHSYVGFINAK